MSNNLRGILWALCATAASSIAAIMVKFAALDFHVLQILFFRQIIIFLSVVPAVTRTFPQNLKTAFPLIHAIRLTGAFIALSAGFWAVSTLPLTTATVLFFSRTFFVTLLAAWFLSEPFGSHRLGAIALGFLGVLIVVRPSLQGMADPNALVAIAGAIAAAVAAVTVRKLSQTETTATLLVYQAIVVGGLSGIAMFWYWVTPDLKQLALLLGIGVLATLAQWLAIKALRLGEAGIISSIGYTQLIYATLLGFLFFAEIPDQFTVLGAAVIVCASIYTIRREILAKSRSN